MPLLVKGVSPVLLNGAGSRCMDILVSDLGRLPDPPRFDDEGPAELWFSPPCMLPIGVGIGTATPGGRLHLALRYRFKRLDRSAAQAFTNPKSSGHVCTCTTRSASTPRSAQVCLPGCACSARCATDPG